MTGANKMRALDEIATRAIGRLFFLEASGGRIHSANADGSNRKVIVSGARIPDDVVVDLETGHIYWTNMGVRFIYWTDRGGPPRRNSVSRASIDADFTKHPTPDILPTHLMEGIGIALETEIAQESKSSSLYTARAKI